MDLEDIMKQHPAKVIRTSSKYAGTEQLFTLVVLLDDEALEKIRTIIREELAELYHELKK